MTMNESSPTCEQRRITFNDDERRVHLARPSYQRHITLACTVCYQLHYPSPSRHYYLRFIAGTNLPTPKGWIAWLAKAVLYADNLCPINWIQRHQKEMNPGCRSEANSIPVNQPHRTLYAENYISENCPVGIKSRTHNLPNSCDRWR